MAFASVSLGASHHPTGEFKNFGECPLNRATIEFCAYSVSSSGSFTIGNKTVPLVHPVTIAAVSDKIKGEGVTPNSQGFTPLDRLAGYLYTHITKQ